MGEGKTFRQDLIRRNAIALLQALNRDSRGGIYNPSRRARDDSISPLIFLAVDVGGAILKEVQPEFYLRTIETEQLQGRMLNQ